MSGRWAFAASGTIGNLWRRGPKRRRVSARRRINYPPERQKLCQICLLGHNKANNCLFLWVTEPKHGRPGPSPGSLAAHRPPGIGWVLDFLCSSRRTGSGWRSLGMDAPELGRHGESQREEHSYSGNRSSMEERRGPQRGDQSLNNKHQQGILALLLCLSFSFRGWRPSRMTESAQADASLLLLYIIANSVSLAWTQQ